MPDRGNHSEPTAVRAAAFLDKGGVGKTTTISHIGVALSDLGRDVLLIDLAGKQNDLAKSFGLFDELGETDADERWPNISTVFTNDWGTITKKLPDAVDDMIWETDEGPDLIPAHPGLDQADDDLASVPVEERFRFLDRFLTDDIEPLGYDAILLDLPGLTNNITLNGLLATQAILAPVELGDFEERQLDELEKDLEGLLAQHDADVSLAMVLPNRVDGRTKLDDELVVELEERYPTRIAPEAVPKSQDIRNAQREGMTIFGLDDPSSTAKRAKTAYEADAEELLDRLEEIQS